MQDRTKNLIVTIGFSAIVILVFLINIVIKDKDISTSERRMLAQFPKITVEKVLNGDVSKKWEDYAIDQFIGRDTFRGIKSFFSINILKQKDNDNLYIKDDSIYKMEYPLNETSVEKTAQKINEIYNKHLQGMNVYYSIIPDKSYYLQNDDHLKIDYDKMQEIMKSNLANIKYINMFEELTLNDYYRTDTHWKQENIKNVVSKIEKEMNLLDTSKTNYVEKELGEFQGVYYGQIGIPVKPDTIKYLTNDTIENCTTYNYETKKESKVYDLEKYKTSMNKYDIFLSGPTPLITVENPNSKTDKELLLFRDSFGSSIAPLLIENYKKISLIDIRYLSSDLLDQYIEFTNQDVLFLYSNLVINQNILK